MSARRRPGCLLMLIILSLAIGFLYWLLFSPATQTSPSGENGLSQTGVVDGELSPQQQAGYETLAAKSGKTPRVIARNGTVGFVSANVSIPDSIAISPSEKALYFLEQNKSLFQIENVHKNLRVQNTNKDDWGNTFITYTQEYQGVQVYGSSITVGITANGEVNLVNGGYLPNLLMNVRPTVRSTDAENIAIADYGAQDGTLSGLTVLAIYSPRVWGGEDAAPPKLVWIVTVASKADPSSDRARYIVDALSGTIVDFISLGLKVGGIPYVEIYDARGDGRVDATLLFHQQGTYTAVANELSQSAVAARDAFFQIHEYYWNTFGRTSIDRVGSLLKIYVDVGDGHDGCPDDTASWNHGAVTEGDEYIIMCSGRAQELDILAHEVGHGIVGYDAELSASEGEPGALNEAYADLFAVFLHDDNRWQLTVSGVTARDLANPPSSCAAAQDEQYGCIHFNSSVFSHAAYLMYTQGVSKNKLQYIYYFSLSHGINNSTTLARAANVVYETCGWLVSESFPPKLSAKDCEIVYDVFASAGLIQLSSTPPLTPSPNAPTPLPDLFTPAPDALTPVPDTPSNPENWFDRIQQQVREWVDQKMGDLRQRIEDQINQLWESLQQKMEEGLQNLLQQLLDQFLQAINQISVELCGLPLMSAVIPVGAVLLGRRRRKKYNSRND